MNLVKLVVPKVIVFVREFDVNAAIAFFDADFVSFYSAFSASSRRAKAKEQRLVQQHEVLCIILVVHNH